MRIGASVGASGDPEKLASRSADLESAGVEHLWVGEAYSADGVSTMGFLAAVTERATIGSSILPFYTRTPTLLAMTALGVHRLSRGRFILGLGASGPQVVEGLHGLPYDAPLARTQEIVDICRMVWRGEKVVHDGGHYHIPLPTGQGTGLSKALRVRDRSLPVDIPIFIAALGPKNVELAARVANGWMPLHYWPERTDVWKAALDAGLAGRDASLGALDVVAGGQLAITEDFQELRNRLRPTLAFYFGGMGAKSKNFYNDLLRRYGYEDEAEKIQDAWLAGRQSEAEGAVPQELVDAVSLVGPRSWVRERVEAYRASGVSILNVEATGPNRYKDIETVREWLE